MTALSNETVARLVERLKDSRCYADHRVVREAASTIEGLSKRTDLLEEECIRRVEQIKLIARERDEAEDRAEAAESELAKARDRLTAAIRAAKLALFVINKQGVMPNSSWKSGFNKDLAAAENAAGAGRLALESKAPQDKEEGSR